jgi:LmbE family N-acetylglucosaminyl deacetylase
MLVLGEAPLTSGVERVLCLGAHADDIEIGCGGAVLKLLDAAVGRVSVDWVVLSASDGRGQEATRSAEAFLRNAKEFNVVVEKFRMSYFPYVGAEVKDAFERIAADVAPDLVFTHSRDDLHQDHRLVAELTWNTWRDHLILEYEIPKYDGDLGRPNVFVHLDRLQCDRKVELLLEHFPSQRGKPWFTEDTFRALLRLRGVEARAPSGFAEAFIGRKLVLA